MASKNNPYQGYNLCLATIIIGHPVATYNNMSVTNLPY